MNFIVNYNLKKLLEENIEFEVEGLLIYENRIITFSKSYDYLLNFENNHLQEYISTYIDLEIIDDVYTLSSKINCFSTHFNIFFSNYNKKNEILKDLKNKIDDVRIENTRNHLNFLYALFNQMSKIIYEYNSLKTTENENYVFSLAMQGDSLNSYYKTYTKAFKTCFKMDKIKECVEILNNFNCKENIKNYDINIKDSLLLSSTYLEILNNMYELMQEQCDMKSEVMEELELIQFNMQLISGSLTIIKNNLINFRQKINSIQI